MNDGTSQTSFHLLYVPIGTMEDATRLARSAVGQRLCACVNIIPAMTSVYEWEGEILSEPELVCIFKTTGETLKELTRFIEAEHPYDLPAIITLPATANPGFMQWCLQTEDRS